MKRKKIKQPSFTEEYFLEAFTSNVIVLWYVTVFIGLFSMMFLWEDTIGALNYHWYAEMSMAIITVMSIVLIYPAIVLSFYVVVILLRGLYKVLAIGAK